MERKLANDRRRRVRQYNFSQVPAIEPARWNTGSHIFQISMPTKRSTKFSHTSTIKVDPRRQAGRYRPISPSNDELHRGHFFEIPALPIPDVVPLDNTYFNVLLQDSLVPRSHLVHFARILLELVPTQRAS